VSRNPDPGFAPEIVVLYCRQTLDVDTRLPEGTRQGQGYSARMVLLPCSSKMEAYQLLKLVEHGADGVLLVACPKKACRFLVGNNRAERRVTHVRGLLVQAGMGETRLELTRAANITLDDLMTMAARQAEQVRTLGPNPMKGGIS
jgi:coenzyme F420-reducing hydrogenase delta subunit